MGALDGLIRLLGGHDLRFSAIEWSVFLKEEHEEPSIRSEQEIVLDGRFSNWPVWDGMVKAHFRSHPFESPQFDSNGTPVCGLVFWETGQIQPDERPLKDVEDGAIYVRCAVTPETFGSILVALKQGCRVSADFTLAVEKPETWDGKEPLKVRGFSVHVQG